jgi:hypothetical protein
MKYSTTTFAYLNVFAVSITKVHIYIYSEREREREYHEDAQHPHHQLYMSQDSSSLGWLALHIKMLGT